jgi:hypothetical protein
MSATIQLKPFVIDQVFGPMQGPIKHQFLSLDLGDQEFFWLLGAKVEIHDGKKSVPQYLCHTRLGVVKNTQNLDELDTLRREYDITRLVSISQGNTDVTFPPGYGVKVHLPKGERSVAFGAQLQSPEFKGPAKTLKVSATLTYMRGPDGDKAGIKELVPFRFRNNPRRSRANFVGPVPSGYEAKTGEFMVPPGLHQYSLGFPPNTLEFTGEETVVHYVRMHLHAYATKMILYDETAKRVVWTGVAKTDPASGALRYVDRYISAEGFKIYRSHAYRLTSEYNNPKNHDIDAMMFLTAYAAKE